MTDKNICKTNEAALRANSYPGRGIIIGMSDRGIMTQVYWIMGRSSNSRNRIFKADPDGSVRTEAYDESKLEDPSLVIYHPARNHGSVHIITNGDQTDTIFDSIKAGGSFESALMTRTFEPDPPNYTPRISGILDVSDKRGGFKLSILKSAAGDPGCALRFFYDFENSSPGFGRCIHTYDGDGNPLPSFSREPYPVSLEGGADEIAAYYWSLLDADNRVSLLVKQFDQADPATSTIKIINANKEEIKK